MSAPHIHLILNHFPVVGAAAAAGLLTLAALMRRDVLARAGLWALVVSAAVAVPVYLSGEGAEDVVEELGVAEAVIEAHEEAALLALVALLVLGAVSASALWLYRRRRAVPRKLVVGLWVLSLGAGLLVARAANRGGEIRHTEIRGELFGGAAAAEAEGAADDREDRLEEADEEADDDRDRRDRDDD
jgi:uncharacterized membrane protein